MEEPTKGGKEEGRSGATRKRRSSREEETCSNYNNETKTLKKERRWKLWEYGEAKWRRMEEVYMQGHTTEGRREGKPKKEKCKLSIHG